MPVRRLVGTVDAVAVELPGAQPVHVAVPDLVGTLRQGGAARSRAGPWRRKGRARRRVACAEKRAKLTPLPSHVAPSGAGTAFLQARHQRSDPAHHGRRDQLSSVGPEAEAPRGALRQRWGWLFLVSTSRKSWTNRRRCCFRARPSSTASALCVPRAACSSPRAMAVARPAWSYGLTISAASSSCAAPAKRERTRTPGILRAPARQHIPWRRGSCRRAAA